MQSFGGQTKSIMVFLKVAYRTKCNTVSCLGRFILQATFTNLFKGVKLRIDWIEYTGLEGIDWLRQSILALTFYCSEWTQTVRIIAVIHVRCSSRPFLADLISRQWSFWSNRCKFGVTLSIKYIFFKLLHPFLLSQVIIISFLLVTMERKSDSKKYTWRCAAIIAIF